jgi:hypothetical protein
MVAALDGVKKNMYKDNVLYDIFIRQAIFFKAIVTNYHTHSSKNSFYICLNFKYYVMKKIFTLLFILISSLSLFAQNPVPNPGFELWTGTEPDNWGTVNSPPDFPVIQTTPGHSGSLALKGQAVVLGPGSTLAPFVASTTAGMGFPVSQTYSELSFWYVAVVQPGDEFEVNVLIADSALNTVEFAIQSYTSTVSLGYTQATVPLNIVGAMPASCIIVFTITHTGGGAVDPGSYFIVDDVALNNAAGINDPSSEKELFGIYPNPVSDKLTIELKGKATESGSILRVLDLSGRELLMKPIDLMQQDKYTLETAELIPGTYIVELSNENRVQRKMFIRQ